MKFSPPYLLFIGNATDPLSIKMATSAANWRPQYCVGEYSLKGCTVSTGLQELSIDEAVDQGAKTFVLGFANSGGILAPEWIPMIEQALEAGLDIVSGLHDKLTSIPRLVDKAQELGRQLIDIRHPTTRFKTAKGTPRTGKRLLTVGTDCSVGKMYTSLSLSEELSSQNIPSTFRATGQSGILVAGSGIAIDCVVADFISGAVEALTPDNNDNHWDIIEGQGSLSHPAFAGVSLGLVHGAQPDAIVVCHALGRDHMRALPGRPLPSLAHTIEINTSAAQVTNPNAKVIGVSVNTSAVSEIQAFRYCETISSELGLPCVDPARHGVGVLVDQIK